MNVTGARVVTFTLLVNLRRGYPLFSLLAAVGIALALHRLWVRSGRPRGIAQAEMQAERELK